jgi:hypothetical protein
MAGKDLKLRLHVGIGSDADAAELDAMTSSLREELLNLDIDTVGRPPGRQPPPGARAVDLPTLGTLLVVAHREAVGALVQTLISWIGRRRSRSVKVELDGDVLELSNASVGEQRHAAEAFFARHDQ